MEFIYLKFKPISLEKHLEICIRYKEDAFICSFGASDKFHEEDEKGSERYIRILKSKLLELPESCVHLWYGNDIIGQIELSVFNKELSIGYINLFYIIPKYRGKGISNYLEKYAVDFFKKRFFNSIRLSVSIHNKRAIQFYLKNGWIDIGERKDRSDTNYMDKFI